MSRIDVNHRLRMVHVYPSVLLEFCLHRQSFYDATDFDLRSWCKRPSGVKSAILDVVVILDQIVILLHFCLWVLDLLIVTSSYFLELLITPHIRNPFYRFGIRARKGQRISSEPLLDVSF